MQRVTLSAHGPTVSRIAFGTWRVLDDPVAGSVNGLSRLLRTAVDVGMTTIDTAEIYGTYRTEERLGEALRHDAGLKSRVEIVTKAGIYVPHAGEPGRWVAHYNATAGQLMASAERSLKWLGVEILDLFLVHRPDWLTPHGETADGLNNLLQSGKVKAVGVSNYSPPQFRALNQLMNGKLATNQVEFSLHHLEPMFDGTFDECQAAAVRPMAWSPSGGGRLFGDDAVANRVRAALPAGMELDRAALAWVVANPAAPVAVIGTTKAERVRAAAAADGVTLSREQWYLLTEAARGARIP